VTQKDEIFLTVYQWFKRKASILTSFSSFFLSQGIACMRNGFTFALPLKQKELFTERD